MVCVGEAEGSLEVVGVVDELVLDIVCAVHGPDACGEKDGRRVAW